MEQTPINPQESALLFAPFAKTGEAVALAVSGGPDSTALALCAKNAGLKAVALIVEHGLRPESPAEAQSVKERMEGLGLEAEILRWEHGAVESRIHVEARKARYDLLIEACRKRGIKKLFLAHHRGDQAETILMRLAKGSGIEGLSGMAAQMERDGVNLMRPFLSLAKKRLIATCEAAGVSFVTDPSNDLAKYARGRLRAAADILEKEGLSEDRLIDLGQRAAEAAEAIALAAKDFLRGAASLTEGGAIELNLEGFNALPRAVALKALSFCLLTIRPALYPPERKNLLSLYEALLGGDEARTLHGVEIRKTGKQASFVREFAAIDDVQPISAGQTFLWDGRWRVTTEEAGEIRALGTQTHETLDRFSPDLRKKIPQGRVRAALPALWQGGLPVAVLSFSDEKESKIKALLSGPLWK